MMKWISIYIVCMLVTLSSCKNNKESKSDNQNIKSFKFDVSSKGDNNLNDYLDLVKIVPLETNSESFFRQIGDLHITSDELVVWDNVSDKILTFDYNGKFKSQIGSKGKGPNEYSNISYFNLTTNPTVYYIYEQKKHKVNGYNQEGEFVKEYKIPSYYSYFLVDKNGDIILFQCSNDLSNGKKEDHFCVLNKRSGKVYSGLTGDEDYWLTLATSNKFPISEVNEQLISLYIPQNDTIYQYADGKLEPRFFIDLGEFALSNKKKQQIVKQSKGDVMEFGRLVSDQDELTSGRSMWLENSNCFFNIRTNKEPGVHYLLHDKRTKTNKVFHSLSQEIMWSSFFYPAGIVKGNSEYDLVFLVSALQLKKLQQPAYQNDFLKYCEKYPHQGEMIKEVLNQITENDNNVLIFTKLKE